RRRYVQHEREAFGAAHVVRGYGGGAMEGSYRRGEVRDSDSGGHFGFGGVPPTGIAGSIRSAGALGLHEAAFPGIRSVLRVPGNRLLRGCGVRTVVQMVEGGIQAGPLARPGGNGPEIARAQPAFLTHFLLRSRASRRKGARNAG